MRSPRSERLILLAAGLLAILGLAGALLTQDLGLRAVWMLAASAGGGLAWAGERRARRRQQAALEEADRRLHQVSRQLDEAHRATARFLSTMGHELKTPLHAIRGYAQLLLGEAGGPLTRSQREDVEAILQAGDHLLELIDTILSFTRTGEEREPLHLEPLDLVEVVGRAWDHVSFLAEQRRVRLRLLAPRQVRVVADRTKLRQIFINLFHNAVKFTQDGVVQVRLVPGDALTLIEVSDTGQGVEPDLLERIFQPFVQGTGRREASSQGLGLGLAVVRRFVHLHGGRVWAEAGHRVEGEARPGGTTFVVQLPTWGPPAGDASTEEAGLGADSGRGR